MKKLLSRMKRATNAFLNEDYSNKTLPEEILNELKKHGSAPATNLDELISTLFGMLREEAPDSGALCISMDNGSLVIAAEDIESASRLVEQYSDSIMDEIAEDFGYFGGPIEA